jgi:transposase
MRYYSGTHKFYCGVDLHTKSMFCHITNPQHQILASKKIPCNEKAFLDFIQDFRDDLIVGCECIFSWYWLADLCKKVGVPFLLGHALYMRSIQAGKTKNDKIDSQKIALLIKGGNFPMAYVYPAEMRPVRDLLRRRTELVRARGKMLSHIKITSYQYNLPVMEFSARYKSHTDTILAQFEDPMVKENVRVDLEVGHFLTDTIAPLEKLILEAAKENHLTDLELLKTIPGCGKIISLTLLYEIQTIARFQSVQKFCSYCRLVKGQKESAGKVYGSKGGKIGNAYLRWAFSELTIHCIQNFPEAKKYVERMERKHGKGKALGILAHRLGRTVYYMLLRQTAFDPKRFLNS